MQNLSATIHHETSFQFRYLFCIIILIMECYILGVALQVQNNRIFVIATMSVCVLFCTYFIWFVGFRKYKTSAQGVSFPTMNPIRPKLVPWNSMLKIIPRGSQYDLVASDGHTYKFPLQLEKFDQFIAAFHSRSIPIETRNLRMVRIRLIDSPNEEEEDDEQQAVEQAPLLDPVKKVMSTHRSVLRLLTGIVLVVYSVFMGLGIFYASGHIITQLTFLLVTILMLILGPVLIEQTLNGHITIYGDGMEFRSGYGKRKFISWDQFRYARIVDFSSDPHHSQQEARIYIHDKDDYIASIPEATEAFEPVLAQLLERGIRLYEETDPVEDNTDEPPLEDA